jgi:hypothetical protein
MPKFFAISILEVSDGVSEFEVSSVRETAIFLILFRASVDRDARYDALSLIGLTSFSIRDSSH